MALLAASLTLSALAALALAAAPAPPPAPGCPPEGAAVVVNTRERVLELCEAGRLVESFPVALGRGGVDKRRRGDARTPLGDYALGAPRPSSRFGTFIPLGYPTPQQSGRGFTGGDVGIHGPHRLTAGTWLALRFDWTEGCIATGSDEDLARIASFVRRRRPRAVIY